MSQYANKQISTFREDANSSWAKTFALIPEKSMVLDVGCSAGIFGAELIKKKQCVVDGIEIDEGDFAKAQKKLRNVYRYNVETDELDIAEKYDIIFMGDVIEHLARPVPALHKLQALLKPDGQLVFSIPNITHMSVRLMLLGGDIMYGKTGLLDETHLHFYNQEEIERVLREAGFVIKHFDYTVNDVPFELAKEKLAELGLTPKESFKKLLSSTNAVAYQFVGAAVPGSPSAKRPSLPDSSPHNIVGTYIDEMKQDYEKVIADLKFHLQKTAEDRDRIAQDRDRIRAQMDRTLAGQLVHYAKRLKSRRKDA